MFKEFQSISCALFFMKESRKGENMFKDISGLKFELSLALKVSKMV